MAYSIYMGKTLLPVPPSKLQLKISNQNKTLTLINDGEINILKKPGLSEIDFEVILPQINYPFATYKNEFQRASVYLEEFERLKVNKEPFQFIVVRTTPNGSPLFGNNIKVSLEDYSVEENSENIFDLMISVKLKQYKDFGTKTIKTSFANEITRTTLINARESANSPKPTNIPKKYTVVSGDSLWSIAKTFYDNGSKYADIYNANQSIIDSENKGTESTKHVVHPGQVLTIPI